MNIEDQDFRITKKQLLENVAEEKINFCHEVFSEMFDIDLEVVLGKL